MASRENTPSPHVWPKKLLSGRQEFFYHPVVLLLGSIDQAGLGPYPAPDKRTEKADWCPETIAGAGA